MSKALKIIFAVAVIGSMGVTAVVTTASIRNDTTASAHNDRQEAVAELPSQSKVISAITDFNNYVNNDGWHVYVDAINKDIKQPDAYLAGIAKKNNGMISNPAVIPHFITIRSSNPSSFGTGLVIEEKDLTLSSHDIALALRSCMVGVIGKTSIPEDYKDIPEGVASQLYDISESTKEFRALSQSNGIAFVTRQVGTSDAIGSPEYPIAFSEKCLTALHAEVTSLSDYEQKTSDSRYKESASHIQHGVSIFEQSKKFY